MKDRNRHKKSIKGIEQAQLVYVKDIIIIIIIIIIGWLVYSANLSVKKTQCASPHQSR